MTKIEWVKSADGGQGRTWNPIRGCTRVSPGCGGPGPHGGCYAEGIAARFSGPGQAYHGIAEMRGGKPRWTGKLAFVEDKLTEPLRVRKPTTWFVNSMSDLFHEAVPDEWIDRVFAVMALAPQHTFQVLTKRSARMREWSRLNSTGGHILHVASEIGEPKSGRWPLSNVWIGVSCEDQQRADDRVPDLLATPAAARFVSAEPLLSRIDFLRTPRIGDTWDWLTGEREACRGKTTTPRLDWIICGSESGPRARPCNLDWVRSIKDQCVTAGVPFFWKQHVENGRKNSLPQLDGRTWAELPRRTNVS